MTLVPLDLWCTWDDCHISEAQWAGCTYEHQCTSPSHITLAQPWTEGLVVFFKISRSLLLVNGFAQHIAVSLDVACNRLIMNHCFAWAWFFELLSEITYALLLSSLKAQHCSKLSSPWPSSCLQSSTSICTSQGLQMVKSWWQSIQTPVCVFVAVSFLEKLLIDGWAGCGSWQPRTINYS